ncbi:MAG: polymer-forming cytoskeletal protein [Anaerolineaceae bacterium]
MKKRVWFLSLITVFSICLLLTSSVQAQSPTPPAGGTNFQGDKVIFADTFRLQAGESLTGNLAVIGGTVTIENGASVTGDIVLLGGTVSVNGTVNGNLVAIGGAASLGDTAVINGDIVTVGASLKKSDLAKVTGTITEQTPSANLGQGDGWQFPWQSKQNLLSSFLTAAFESLALAALAVVLGLLLPKQIQRVTNSIQSEPLVAGGVGLLTIVGSPVLLLILVVTIVLIPVALLFILTFGLAFVFGWMALGNFIGQKLDKLFPGSWSVAVSSGIGTLILSLVVGTLNLIPCVGWVIGFIFGLLGLGAVVITRFGSTDSSQKKVSPSTPPVSPEPPLMPPTA